MMSQPKKTDREVLDLIRGIISGINEGVYGPNYYPDEEAMHDILCVMEDNKETCKSAEVQLLQNTQELERLLSIIRMSDDEIRKMIVHHRGFGGDQRL